MTEPIKEFGEIGRLVELSSSRDMVIIWAVREVKDMDGKPAYNTSSGWRRGEMYFSPKPRERSLRPCIQRAIQYAREKYPNLPAQTH